MSEKISITPELEIPEHLVGQIQSKLAYVDEAILGVHVSENG